MEQLTIAIDGPAASGKSTVGCRLAEALGYVYFDTGVMYRAVTLAALRRGVPIVDEPRVAELARQVTIEVTHPTVDDGRQYTVLLDGDDVTWALRSQAVNDGVSPVAANPGVREALYHEQRRIGGRGGMVMVGRDIGTVILPEAQVKVYLDAEVEERARRRHKENVERGIPSEFDAVLAELTRRDRIDSGRATAPLTRAPDAAYVDSTHLSVDEVVERILALVRARCASEAPQP